MANDLTIRMVDSLGCTIAGTAVIYSLLEWFPNCNIAVITQHPSLFEGIENIRVMKPDQLEQTYSIDLRGYTTRRPHTTSPLEPSYIHMIKMARTQLQTNLPIKTPGLFLSSSEIDWAKDIINRFKNPVIWLQEY